MTDRVCVALVGLGALNLASMLFRCVVAAQTPTSPAAAIVAQIGG